MVTVFRQEGENFQTSGKRDMRLAHRRPITKLGGVGGAGDLRGGEKA